MRKLISFMFALVLVLGLSTAALAEETKPTDPNGGKEDGFVDEEVCYITKNYDLTNPGTLSPAEEIAFTWEKVGVTDAAGGITVDTMPDLVAVEKVRYAKGDAGSADAARHVKITLPSYSSVGIYTYNIRETQGKKAGVTYYSGPILLKVTVVRQEDGLYRVAAVHTESGEEGDKAKKDTFANRYSAGALEIAKTVTGNMGDKTKYFEITVKLEGEAGMSYDNPYTVSGGTHPGNAGTVSVPGEYTFQIKDGETITVENLPYQVKYTVTEASYAGEGYDRPVFTAEGGQGEEISQDGRTEEVLRTGAGTVDCAAETVGITNNKGVPVDTGVNLDSVPYILLLTAAVGGMAVLAVKKRRAE